MGCGNEGELHHLLRFFLVDVFGNKVNVDDTTDIQAVLDDTDESVYCNSITCIFSKADHACHW